MRGIIISGRFKIYFEVLERPSADTITVLFPERNTDLAFFLRVKRSDAPGAMLFGDNVWGLHYFGENG